MSTASSIPCSQWRWFSLQHPATTVLYPSGAHPEGGGVVDNNNSNSRKGQRWCSPQTADNGGCQQHFAGGDDDDKDSSCPSRRWNDKDGRVNDIIRRPEETDVLTMTMMINMCGVSKRGNEMTVTHANTPGR